MKIETLGIELGLLPAPLAFRFGAAEFHAVGLGDPLLFGAGPGFPGLTKIDDPGHPCPAYTSRLCSTAAAMNDLNSGCGSNGRDFSSGWYCTPMNQG